MTEPLALALAWIGIGIEGQLGPELQEEPLLEEIGGQLELALVEIMALNEAFPWVAAEFVCVSCLEGPWD